MSVTSQAAHRVEGRRSSCAPLVQTPLQQNFHFIAAFHEPLCKLLTQTTLKLKEIIPWGSLYFAAEPSRKPGKFCTEEGCGGFGTLKLTSLYLVYLFCCLEYQVRNW